MIVGIGKGKDRPDGSRHGVDPTALMDETLHHDGTADLAVLIATSTMAFCHPGRTTHRQDGLPQWSL